MHSNYNKTNKGASPYSAVITREQFLFYEIRTTANLIDQGLTENQIVEKIASENLFQYPTEKSLRKMAFTCIRRLNALNDPVLISAIATRPSSEAKQICLYAMMKQYRLMWDFMITVIGAKFQSCDLSFSRLDLNVFIMRLQEQDDWVASWSESTIVKIKQVIARVLVENEYLDSVNSAHLNPVLIFPILENSIRNSGNTLALSAFNCFN